ncbi:MAG: choice-of-anchor tandem repeat GloVer-containing protein [Bryobacteraceae bacterium]
MSAVYQFPGTDRPATPIYGADGDYYGTAFTYGTHNGYFYKVTPAGSFTRVATLPFQGDGIALQGTDGNFYGVEQSDCSTQHGTIYKMTPAGKFTTLHDFGLCGNATVNSLIEGSDGKLYGVTQGSDVIFSLTSTAAERFTAPPY